MSVIAAVNLIDRLVLLEDGRELPITQFYCSSGPTMLKATDELRFEDRTDDVEIAEVFTVEIPGADAALIVEIAAMRTIGTDTDAKSYN